MDGVEVPPAAIGVGSDVLRFEDLTIDDDLPLLDRVVRYCRSGIALQRLVHVKMLAETAETVGKAATIETMVPLLNPLMSDPESIIRQHLAAQLLPLCITCMIEGIGPLKSSVSDYLDNPSRQRIYYEPGYKVVASTIIPHLNTLIMDNDIDVRRSASEALAGLAWHIRPNDIAELILPIPLRLALQTKSKKTEPEGLNDELRTTATNLLAELSGASESGPVSTDLVRHYIMPAVLSLCTDTSFRVRRSATQALPRVLGGSSFDDAKQRVIPAFEKLSKDAMYRVRKSTGECLVDMSRSLIILASKIGDNQQKEELKNLRRTILVPIAIALLEDANKFVRHGMMQFLGPFIASFYPLDEGRNALGVILPGVTPSSEVMPPVDGSSSSGIGTQFFPHASSMVSRLNSSMSSNISSPAPTPATYNTPNPVLSEMERLHQMLPQFLRANRLSIVSLRTVVTHRETSPPDAEDVSIITAKLLKYFVELAKVSTGDDNTDAEMRVYCAYSYPAVVLLLGAANWEGMLRDCFMKLINPSHPAEFNTDTGASPSLPVKRCLASSLHTVAHILGPEYAQADILPAFRDYFFRDTDDSVRLNMIRNFPWLISLLPHASRSEYLSMWFDVVKGDELLGAHKKRSVTNPMLLNWRQRDYVSRSVPDMLTVLEPSQVQQFLWPILQMLLTDSVSLVREDAVWSIPLLLRTFCSANVGVTERKESSDKAVVAKRRWNADMCQEVVVWFKETILKVPTRGPKSNGDSGKGANFSQRQLYCRICAAIGLALQFSDADEAKDEELSLDMYFQDMLTIDGSARNQNGGRGPYAPYKTLTPEERNHLRRFLVFDLLPLALEMKDDRVTNVRLTLMKCLQILPNDVKGLGTVRSVLQDLEDEVETWESFSGNGETTNLNGARASNGTMMINVTSSVTTTSSSDLPMQQLSIDENLDSEGPDTPPGNLIHQRIATFDKVEVGGKSKKKGRKAAAEISLDKAIAVEGGSSTFTVI